MKNNVLSIVLLILCILSICQSSTKQIDMKENLKNTINSMIIEDVRMHELTLQNIKNIKKLDLYINYIYCNAKIEYFQLEAIMNNKLNKQRLKKQQNVGYKFTCNSRQDAKPKKIKKNQCLLCKKQFTNQTFLVIHYLLRHKINKIESKQQKDQQNQMQKDFKQAEIKEKIKTENFLLIRIMRQPIYKLISSEDLEILFNSQAPKQYIYQFCTDIFDNVLRNLQKQLQPDSRYYEFIKRKDCKNLCTAIVNQIGEAKPWLTAFKYIILILSPVVFVIIIIICYTKIESSIKKRENKQKKY